jgi:hypothetical protein
MKNRRTEQVLPTGRESVILGVVGGGEMVKEGKYGANIGYTCM